MPNLVAGMAGVMAALVIESYTKPQFGIRWSAAASLLTFFAVFWVVRRWLTKLRDGS